MKLHDDPETDGLGMEPGNEPGAGTREVSDGLNADPDAVVHVDGFDIDPVCAHLDPTTLEKAEVPLKATKIARGRGSRAVVVAKLDPGFAIKLELTIARDLNVGFLSNLVCSTLSCGPHRRLALTVTREHPAGNWKRGFGRKFWVFGQGSIL